MEMSNVSTQPEYQPIAHGEHDSSDLDSETDNAQAPLPAVPGDQSAPDSLLQSKSTHPRHWTPFPAKILVVHPFILWNLCVICVLGVLGYLSQSRHGLFATNLQKTEVLVFWHFLPTAIATMNSLIFSAIGAASLRCQPYLHLLRESGAKAKDSLTLDYNGLSLVVPFKALRRGHWVAFMFSLVML